MMQINFKQFILGICVTIIIIFSSLLFPAVFENIDRSILSIEYQLRGTKSVDTSIVILYLDNDDIASLGGLPLKRSYYALLIDALRDLDVGVIGFDIALTESKREFQEYDNLLAAVVEKANNVVISGYFRELSEYQSRDTISVIPDRFLYKKPQGINVMQGHQPELPFENMLKNVNAIGHTHLIGDTRIPLFIQNGQTLFPAFAIEIFRVNDRSPKSDVIISSGDVKINVREATHHIPVNNNMVASINFVGGITDLKMISVVNFLKMYDRIKTNTVYADLLDQFRGKIVLVGIIAEGRSKFIETPFNDEFPVIGVHAFFLHNLLHNNFLRYSPEPINLIIILLCGIICTFLMGIKREVYGWIGLIMLVIMLILISFVFFSNYSYVLPVAAPISTIFLVTVSMLIYKHKLIRGHIDFLAREKEKTTSLLQSKEMQLVKLEKEFQSLQRSDAEKRRTQLQEEITKYKTEVSQLKELAEDLQPASISSEFVKKPCKEFCGIVYGNNGPMEGIVSFIKKIADNNAAVLIYGESGTGKELVARALHENSRRKQKPFIAVNCGALAEGLLESELFGHERGAFTGAVKEKAGRFEMADGGTIFLDEIGETSENFQVKLLRVLQDGTLERVGGTQTKKVDVRVIAATNKNLQQAVDEKRFREDLYYRLKVLEVDLPPLRERIEDIPILAEHFMNQEDKVIKCSKSVIEILKQYAWKGNIRELQSVIKRAALLAKAEERSIVRMKDVSVEITQGEKTLVDLEKKIISLLREKKFSRNSISETADDLGGLNRGTVAEYFRGYCFKTFYECQWNFSKAVMIISQIEDPIINKKVEKKLREYLRNGIELVDLQKTIEQVTITSKSKYKNLPQKYHYYLTEIINAACRSEFKINS
ncbi:MAG: sigma 54-interacting transcriptional regulator [Bacteroidota bacterium]|nr:sigma 54-interacting transcriptional regulator [Bacteroidota bacterium]